MRVLATNVLLAHQGGWDEMAVLVAPVALFAIIRLLERRRRPVDEAQDDAADEPGGPR